MKKFICILAAVILVFAVSCSNDNPSPDVPVVNAPATNTDYSSLTMEQKVRIVDELQKLVLDAYAQEYPALEAAINEELEKLYTSGIQKETFIKENADGTIKILVSYDATSESMPASSVYIDGFAFKNYTIWGVSGDSGSEYTFREDTKETENISKLKIVSDKYYLNNEEIPYSPY